MTSSNTATEVHYHVRSISLPSRQHPSLQKIEKELKKVKTLEASSLETETIKEGLKDLAELYNSVQELIGCPLTQQALIHQHHHVEKPLDISVSLLDICGSAREMMILIREHVLDIQSILRRKGLDSSINTHIDAYICFRKKARKDISKRIKALKIMDGSFKSHSLLDVDHHLVMVINVLRELSNITISFFRNLLHFMRGPVLKKTNRGWSLFSRMVSTRRDGEKRIINEMGDIDVALCSFHRKNGAKADLEFVKRILGDLDGNIRELEAGLDCLFRCLIQQRVSLLNLLTP